MSGLRRLPPLHLYRHILRVHRRLPDEFRYLGDNYVKDEFRRHKDVTNPTFLKGFVTQWHQYLHDLQLQTNTVPTEDKRILLGKKLDTISLDKMNDDMVERLWELRTEAKNPRADGIQQSESQKQPNL
ncbi:ACN9-domain-containing protein [Basidiobolus meristosporus CBS 931.73]|uniref:Succinate dehydrogenase assembly factor 3 n=1 Tax=Basidiobolus meristosporus CBS 931.73 TaxID=1314790 RepID=A0A1Y1XUX7_9FUNG|nr:ACN9-domain-containing protein [Basidiobolus meristosporus CBS 931.73]|eukprot:ORX89084.1 ACN9-domain-containing protein [Basidiobolus meristosporus CBS 931.73]